MCVRFGYKIIHFTTHQYLTLSLPPHNFNFTAADSTVVDSTVHMTGMVVMEFTQYPANHEHA